MHNAKKGGEFGANGEWYKGGQFVADTEDWEKTHNYKPRKVCVAPYQWEVAHAGENAIFHELDRADAVRFSSRKNVDENGVATYENFDFVLAIPICFYDVNRALRGTASHGTLKLIDGYEKTEGYIRFRKFYGTLLGMFIKGERYVSDEFLANLAVASGMVLGDRRDALATLKADDAEAVAAILAPSASVEDEVQMRRRLAGGKGYVGKEGEKMKLALTLTDTITYEGLYGFGTIYKFADENGNVLAWKTTARLTDANGDLVKVDDTVTLTFTVKSHDTFREVPQTNIIRVKAVA